jgi:hypothetical protein
MEVKMLLRFKHPNPITFVESIVANISESHFGSNLYAADIRREGNKGNVRFVLRVKDSRGPGARLSGSGRRTVSATWEVHRLVFDAIFALEPNAVLVTALATYKGYADYIDKFQDTWGKNAGSMMNPVPFGSL